MAAKRFPTQMKIELKKFREKNEALKKAAM